MDKIAKELNDEVVDFVAGRLAPTEMDRLAAAAQRDRSLAAEIATLTAIREGLKSSDSEDAEMLSFGWARLSKALDDDRQRTRAEVSARRWRAIAAGALIACAAQAIALTMGSFSGDARYETASVERKPAFAVQVTFAPTAQEAALRAVLLRADAMIDEGPSSLGVYLLAFESEDAREAGLKVLNSTDGVVTFASAQ